MIKDIGVRFRHSERTVLKCRPYLLYTSVIIKRLFYALERCHRIRTVCGDAIVLHRNFKGDLPVTFCIFLSHNPQMQPNTIVMLFWMHGLKKHIS